MLVAQRMQAGGALAPEDAAAIAYFLGVPAALVVHVAEDVAARAREWAGVPLGF